MEVVPAAPKKRKGNIYSKRPATALPSYRNVACKSLSLRTQAHERKMASDSALTVDELTFLARVQTHATARTARASAAHRHRPPACKSTGTQSARGQRRPEVCRRTCLRYVRLIKNARACSRKSPVRECEGALGWAGVSILAYGGAGRTRPVGRWVSKK